MSFQLPTKCAPIRGTPIQDFLMRPHPEMLDLAGPVPDPETLHPSVFYRILMIDYCQQEK